MEINKMRSFTIKDCLNEESKNNEGNEKHSAVWNTAATLLLLKSYEDKLEMLETPKKKTKIWTAMSDHLKENNIEVTPDQVRWKINALAKKYKQCIDSGEYQKFRYFKEMDHIYSQYNVECSEYSLQYIERTDKNKWARKYTNTNTGVNSLPFSISLAEGKAAIELRKKRLASRIDADRSQSKIRLERQWLQYLKRQEENNKWRDKIFERTLKIKEDELELRRQELEMKETIRLKMLDIKSKEQEEMLCIEKEKCELLKRIYS